jgi:CRAL/TRIO domain
VKFILKCFEANYPESLGVLLIHNAPWVFSGPSSLVLNASLGLVRSAIDFLLTCFGPGVWRLIRGWMDPDIAAKVNFTNSVADLEKYINCDQLVTELGGAEQWKYEYIEPNENENALMADTTTRDALLRERQQIGEEFLAATAEWIESVTTKDKSKIQTADSRRAYLAERLRVNHWKLDPYVRARLCLDRMRVIQDGGKIDFYPKEVTVEEKIQEASKTLEVTHLENVNGNGTQTTVS